MKHRIAIVGPGEIISGFRMLGAEAFHVSSGKEMVEKVQALQKQSNDAKNQEDRYGVVIVVESILKEVSKEEYAKMTKYPIPAIVALPDMKGSSGKSRERLKELTERAVGTDIM